MENHVKELLSDSEENIFRAYSGLPFRCGVCEAFHKTSHNHNRSVRKCIDKLLSMIENRNVCRDVSIEYPEIGEIETIRMMYPDLLAFCRTNVNRVMEAAYPEFCNRYFEEVRYFQDIYSRSLIEEVSVKKALGASNAYRYVTEAITSFKNSVEKTQKDVQQKLLEKIKEVRAKKVEAWECSVFREEDRFYESGGRLIKRITSISLNKNVIIQSSVLGSFTTFHEYEDKWPGRLPDDMEMALLEIGLLNDAPAIVWGISKRVDRSNTDIRKVLLQFLSTWDGGIYLDVNNKAFLMLDPQLDFYAKKKILRGFIRFVPESLQLN